MPCDLRRVNDTGFDHINVFLGIGIKTKALAFVFLYSIDDDRAFEAGIDDDLPDRLRNPLCS